MKKVGIVTIYDYNNYGNRLQNYALQTIFENLGYEVSSFKFYGNSNIDNFLKFRLRNIFRVFRYYLKSMKSLIYFKRIFRNKLFTMKYIKTSENIYQGNIDRIKKHYDFFITGSDQIWNPNFYKNNMYINLLGFIENEKKIAIAPSIAVDNLNKSQIEEFEKYLKKFDHISCRERLGSNLLKNIINKEVDTIIDPTLFFEKEFWERKILKPRFHNDNSGYILLYFVGKMSNENKEIINEYADKKNIQIIDMLDSKSQYYTCNPFEFLYMIHNASLVITDSFHASIFSYTFNVPFRIFRRVETSISMNSRLVNLIEVLGLPDNIYFDGITLLNENFYYEPNLDKITNERKKFKRFINDFINKQ